MTKRPRWPFQELSTERLRLRRQTNADIPRLVGLAGAWEVAKNLGSMPHPYTERDAVQFLMRVRSRDWQNGNLVWALDDGEGLIGGIGLHTRDTPDIELGYWLGQPYWGRGFATEAGRAVVGYAFAALGAACLTAGHFVDNPASGHVLEKLGFERTSQASRYCLARDTEIACVELALTAAQWSAARGILQRNEPVTEPSGTETIASQRAKR